MRAPFCDSEERPRVLMVAQLPPPVHGAAVVSQAIVDSGYLNQRFAIEPYRLAYAASIADLRSFKLAKVGRAFLDALRLWVLTRRKRYAAAYLTLTPSGLGFYRDLFIIYVLRLAGCKLIYHLHGLGVRRASAGRLTRALYEWAFRGANVIHLSHHLELDTAALRGPIKRYVVPNGMAQPPRPCLENSNRGELCRVLFLSNVRESKGIFILLEALSRVLSLGVQIELIVAGPIADAHVEKQIICRLRELAIESHVELVGAVGGSEKVELLRSADIFIHPSLNDAMPLVVLEAMSAGLPIIASDVGAIPEMLAEGDAGLVTPAGSVDALSEALLSLAENNILRTELGIRGRQRFEDNYTTHHFERRLSDVFSEILSS